MRLSELEANLHEARKRWDETITSDAPLQARLAAGQMEHINRVHLSYHPDRWRTLKHYLLLFHDENFACLAKGYSIEVVQDSLEHLVEIARTRLLGKPRSFPEGVSTTPAR